MAWGMFVHELADGQLIDQWLQSYDLETPDPRFRGGGTYTFTADPAQALRFASLTAVMALWQTQAVQRPIRPWDGKPNRPLTQFSVSPMQLPEPPP